MNKERIPGSPTIPMMLRNEHFGDTNCRERAFFSSMRAKEVGAGDEGVKFAQKRCARCGRDSEVAEK